MTPAYKILFLLTGESATLLEIERRDRPTAPKSERYQWLRYDHAADQLTPLDFVAMHAEGEQQARTFRQGRLSFDAQTGSYQPAAGPAQALLAADPADPLAPRLSARLAQWLAAAQ